VSEGLDQQFGAQKLVPEPFFERCIYAGFDLFHILGVIHVPYRKGCTLLACLYHPRRTIRSVLFRNAELGVAQLFCFLRAALARLLEAARRVGTFRERVYGI
jgi:hypothetical protein